MKSKFLVYLLIILISSQLVAQEKASVVLDEAFNLAKAENKNVLVIFHASWCGWCKRMDNNINNKYCKELFERNFVIKHLVVWESPNNKNLENPGAVQLLNMYKGENSGIPFWLIFNSNGEYIISSLDSKGKNIGCPSKENEVNLFGDILKNTTDLNAEELEVIKNVFLIKE